MTEQSGKTVAQELKFPIQAKLTDSRIDSQDEIFFQCRLALVQMINKRHASDQPLTEKEKQDIRTYNTIGGKYGYPLIEEDF